MEVIPLQLHLSQQAVSSHILPCLLLIASPAHKAFLLMYFDGRKLYVATVLLSNATTDGILLSLNRFLCDK